MAPIPAIAGAAQVIQRPGDWTDPADAKGPIELMVEAARAAASDADAPVLLERLDWIGVVGGQWRYANPGQVIAGLLGPPVARTALTMPSGSSPQDLVGVAAEKIGAGDIEVALVVGGEANWSRRRISDAGGSPPWITEPGEGEPERYSVLPPEMIADIVRFSGPPAVSYALMEDSLRVSLGQTIGEHRDRIAGLWQGFSAVAAANPYAWDRTARGAAEIRDASDANRMIAWPYTKAMVANNTVDMASAVILCSVEFAKAHGVPSDGFVFPHSVTSTHETWEVLRRRALHQAPAVTAGGRAALDLAGIGIDDVEHVDLYACFPSIVQMSASALGLGTDRALTVTGGLGFAGAPLANSSGQAIAAMVPLVRQGGWGFVHANGGMATKHAFGVYRATPPAAFVRRDAQDAADLQPREALDDDWIGPVVVEATTVAYEREGAGTVVCAVLSADGQRAWARTTDPSAAAATIAGTLTGTAGHRTAEGGLEI